MEKPAPADHPIADFIARRWSTRVFSPKPVARETLLTLLEAARWAASSNNDQPWSFIVTTRDEPEAFARLLGCLTPGNQAWAKDAPVLMLSVARLAFAHSGKPNRHAFHDVGLAVGGLLAQATALGLFVHQMAGYDVEKTRKELEIPEGHDPVAAIALGYQGDHTQISDEMKARELAPRKRKALAEFSFAGKFGEPY
jgi:nitroreductase